MDVLKYLPVISIIAIILVFWYLDKNISQLKSERSNQEANVNKIMTNILQLESELRKDKNDINNFRNDHNPIDQLNGVVKNEEDNLGDILLKKLTNEFGTNEPQIPIHMVPAMKIQVETVGISDISDLAEKVEEKNIEEITPNKDDLLNVNEKGTILSKDEFTAQKQ